jgi:hypothetical protein
MRRFSDWEKVYESLGIRSGGERLGFDANAPGSAMREAIMAPQRNGPADDAALR